ncbi:MAG: hypothetical protein NDF58_08995 [archaeon YNP-LCB-024-027]|nr:hypothetical protein [Candidatus Culexarchaeum yellowstonense]
MFLFVGRDTEIFYEKMHPRFIYHIDETVNSILKELISLRQIDTQDRTIIFEINGFLCILIGGQYLLMFDPTTAKCRYTAINIHRAYVPNLISLGRKRILYTPYALFYFSFYPSRPEILYAKTDSFVDPAVDIFPLHIQPNGPDYFVKFYGDDNFKSISLFKEHDNRYYSACWFYHLPFQSRRLTLRLSTPETLNTISQISVEKTSTLRTLYDNVQLTKHTPGDPIMQIVDEEEYGYFQVHFTHRGTTISDRITTIFRGKLYNEALRLYDLDVLYDIFRMLKENS